LNEGDTTYLKKNTKRGGRKKSGERERKRKKNGKNKTFLWFNFV
jgi:hypothetical protein